MGRVRLVRQVGREGQMGQVDGERIVNFELGTSYKLAPAGEKLLKEAENKDDKTQYNDIIDKANDFEQKFNQQKIV